MRGLRPRFFRNRNPVGCLNNRPKIGAQRCHGAFHRRFGSRSANWSDHDATAIRALSDGAVKPEIQLRRTR